MEQQQNDKSTFSIHHTWMGIFSIIFTSFTNCFGIAGIVFGALTISRGKKFTVSLLL